VHQFAHCFPLQQALLVRHVGGNQLDGGFRRIARTLLGAEDGTVIGTAQVALQRKSSIDNPALPSFKTLAHIVSLIGEPQ